MPPSTLFIHNSFYSDFVTMSGKELYHRMSCAGESTHVGEGNRYRTPGVLKVQTKTVVFGSPLDKLASDKLTLLELFEGSRTSFSISAAHPC